MGHSNRQVEAHKTIVSFDFFHLSIVIQFED